MRDLRPNGKKAMDLEGTVRTVSGAPIASYEVDTFDMHLTQIVHGTLTQSTQVITFTEPFIGVLTADNYAIESTPLGPWQTTEYVTQVTGSLNPSTGVLTLNFTLNMDGGVVTMTIETYD